MEGRCKLQGTKRAECAEDVGGDASAFKTLNHCYMKLFYHEEENARR